MPKSPKRIFLIGSTGTIGKAVLAELGVRGFATTCWRRGQPLETINGHDTVISCMASRTGAPDDAWAVDHDQHIAVLDAAKTAGVTQFILLSAICVQKPRLAFQHAKLAFEKALRDSGLTYSIIRPTAYFKSVSGQVKRVQAGKPFLLFDNGERTSCLPISNADLARYIVNALGDKAMHNAILPIGGPGPAFTPRAMGEMLFELTGKPPRFRTIPVALLRAIIATLSALGRLSPQLKAKAELARIGHYYATESMLVWDLKTQRYDENTTPIFGRDTLREHFAKLISGNESTELGDHAVF